MGTYPPSPAAVAAPIRSYWTSRTRSQHHKLGQIPGTVSPDSITFKQKINKKAFHYTISHTDSFPLSRTGSLLAKYWLHNFGYINFGVLTASTHKSPTNYIHIVFSYQDNIAHQKSQ